MTEVFYDHLAKTRHQIHQHPEDVYKRQHTNLGDIILMSVLHVVTVRRKIGKSFLNTEK